MYDGLDSYLNEQFMKMEAKKHKLEAPDSDRNKGNHTKKNPSEVFKRLTIGLNTPLNLARKGVIMDNQSRKTIQYVSLTDKTQSLIKIEAMKRDLEAKQAALDFSQASASLEAPEKTFIIPKWKQDQHTQDEVSTMFSDVSHADFMNQIKKQEIGKNGKKKIPAYLKEDFPDHTMLPAKELIANLPTHVDRPPAEKFDELVTKLYTGMSKKPKKSRAQSQQANKHLNNDQLQAKQRQMQIKNYQDQLHSDEQYKQMFGGEDLHIMRKPLKLRGGGTTADPQKQSLSNLSQISP